MAMCAKTDVDGRKSWRQLGCLKGMPPDDDDDDLYISVTIAL